MEGSRKSSDLLVADRVAEIISSGTSLSIQSPKSIDGVADIHYTVRKVEIGHPKGFWIFARSGLRPSKVT
jgi:hypothetical protein